MFNIVLLEPRMPGNVGTIGRLAVATAPYQTLWI